MVSKRMLSLPANGEVGNGLTRQPSSYPPRLEEIHGAMNDAGKSFDSMNMEEIMKNMWGGEDSKAGVAALVSSENGLDGHNSLSFPSLSSNKTAEDVWGDIQRQSAAELTDKQQEQTPSSSHPHPQQNPHERQATLGEMTLEDFLVRTGVVRENLEAASHTAESNNFYPAVTTASASNGFPMAIDTLAPGMQNDWMNYPPHQQQLLQQAEAIGAAKRGFQPPLITHPASSPMYDGLADNVVPGPDRFAGSLSLSPAFSDYSSHTRKRFSSEVAVEKTMERRQKRMIKNRESAARSRARKQAYTVELEAEVILLKEENARLKQQQVAQIRQPEVTYTQSSKLQALRRTKSY